jgi:hypothetical protein
MSWSNFLPFAAGFIKGFIEEYTRPEPASTTSSLDGYDFHRHMAALAEATGVRLATLHERRASFAFSFRREQYFASAVLVQDKISVAVFSKIEFPIRAMPAELVRAVKSLNAKLPHCDFEIIDMEDGTCVWCAQGATAATSLTPSVFEAALAKMVSCIARLDAWMVEHGFAR